MISVESGEWQGVPGEWWTWPSGNRTFVTHEMLSDIVFTSNLSDEDLSTPQSEMLTPTGRKDYAP